MLRIIKELKAARRKKGFSQQRLSELSGVPQSHISKIEAGKTDPRVSSLAEISSFLDYQMVLIPRKYMPAIRAIVNGEDSRKPAYLPDEDLEGENE